LEPGKRIDYVSLEIDEVVRVPPTLVGILIVDEVEEAH
jgi:hypothetical protein